MDLNLESIIFYVLLIDALGANILAWAGTQKWWHRHVPTLSQYFPLVRGWTTYYLIVVLIMGVLLYRLGALVLPV